MGLTPVGCMGSHLNTVLRFVLEQRPCEGGHVLEGNVAGGWRRGGREVIVTAPAPEPLRPATSSFSCGAVEAISSWP